MSLEEQDEDWSQPTCQQWLSNIHQDELHSKRDPSSLGVDHHHGTARCMPPLNHKRVIVHIDLDCYYAQVEMVRNPALQSKPLGIQQKSILVTCNYVARAQGVTKLMLVTEAVQRCPELVIVSGEDLTPYRETSYKITGLLGEFSNLVQRLGFDENFIDVTQLVAKRLHQDDMERDVVGHVFNENNDLNMDSESTSRSVCKCGCHQRLTIGSHIAEEMRRSLNAQLGLTSCAGVAHNKQLAKLVGSKNKPNAQTTVFPHMAEALMGTLDRPTQILGIGHATGKKLSDMGITTLTDMLQATVLLKNEFGQQTASSLLRKCQGHDDSPVVQSGPPQSISDEDSFKKCSTLQHAKNKMEELLTSLIHRLKCDGRQPHTLRLTVRKHSFTHDHTIRGLRESRQCTIPDGVLHILRTDEAAAKSKLVDICVDLLHKMVDISRSFHLTLMNVCFTKFQSATSPSSGADDISRYFSSKATTSSSQLGVEEGRANVKLNGNRKMLSLGKNKGKRVEDLGSCTIPHHKELRDTKTSASANKQSFFATKTKLEGSDDPMQCPMSEGSSPSSEGSLIDYLDRLKASRVDPLATEPGKTRVIGESTLHEMDSGTVNALVVPPPNVDLQVFAELPSEIQRELMADWQRNNAQKMPICEGTSKPAVSLAENNVLPPEIDRSVFDTLPTDIQRDVLQNSAHRKRLLQSPLKRKSSGGKRLKVAPNMTTASASKDITDFFSAK